MGGTINLEGVSKRFQYNWIFRNLNFEFSSGQPVAITGPNGSGKSTLVQIIAGLVTPSEGSIQYTLGEQSVPVEDVYKYLSMSAPALEIIEEMTLREMLNFHFNFKKPVDNVTKDSIIQMLGFDANKEIRNYSSGMKQRLKLALAVFSQSAVLILDEPTNNLDEEGQQWYHHLIGEFAGNRIVIISSNEPREYTFCKVILNVTDFS